MKTENLLLLAGAAYFLFMQGSTGTSSIYNPFTDVDPRSTAAVEERWTRPTIDRALIPQVYQNTPVTVNLPAEALISGNVWKEDLGTYQNYYISF